MPPAAALLLTRVAQPPRIDGALDEPAWRDALLIDDLTQQLPEDQVAPSERTEARILYDDDNLYLGIRPTCSVSEKPEFKGWESPLSGGPGCGGGR